MQKFFLVTVSMNMLLSTTSYADKVNFAHENKMPLYKSIASGSAMVATGAYLIKKNFWEELAVGYVTAGAGIATTGVGSVLLVSQSATDLLRAPSDEQQALAAEYKALVRYASATQQGKQAGLNENFNKLMENFVCNDCTDAQKASLISSLVMKIDALPFHKVTSEEVIESTLLEMLDKNDSVKNLNLLKRIVILSVASTYIDTGMRP